jgi:hypothetical protein
MKLSYYFNGKIYSIAILFFILFGIYEANAYQKCDSIKSCLGSALYITKTSGKGAQYVDVPMTKSLRQIRDSMTVEMWIYPQRQVGTTQFVGGIWGPGKDVNDSWVMYLTPDDSIVFELNGASTDLGQYDNTRAVAYAGNLFNKWTHIAAVFDGSRQTAYLYISGELMDSARNDSYPLSRLRRTQDDLPLQIGSSNALSNSKQHRTMKGRIDEVRIWNKVLPWFEIYCNMNKSYNYNVANLILYFRFNQTAINYHICDASNYGNHGQARSGAYCKWGGRKIQRKFWSDVTKITDTLVCDTLKRWTITVTDTSLCGGRVWMRILDDLRTSYTITPNKLTLVPNQPVQFTLTLKTNFVGDIKSRLQIISYNRCGSYITIPIRLKRLTELDFSRTSINFDTVVAGCKDVPYIDSTFTICNNTANFGTPRDVTINSVTTGYPGTYQIISKPFPFLVRQGECEIVTVRFWRGDVTKVYNTNITIRSDDVCNPKATIELRGAAFEALVLSRNKKRLDKIDFGTFCINVASPGVQYTWSNQMKTPIYVDTIIMPEHFIGKSLKFPFRLNPQWGYRPNYFRFLPLKQGFFRDSIIFIVRTNECTIERKVYVTGRGLKTDMEFNYHTLDFGNVTVGQQATQNALAKNNGTDTLHVRFYLRKGEVFFLNGAKSVTILPGHSVSIPVTFMPIADADFTDELCYYEVKCGASGCMVLKGKGEVKRLDFIPMVMETQNVVGCGFQLDTLEIRNISNSTQALSQFSFDDPGRRYTLVDPSTLPEFVIIPRDQGKQFIFRYTPNDVLTEHADRAFLNFRTSEGEKWNAKLLGTSVIPKIFVTESRKYGTIEVGDVKRDTLLIENISPFPIHIDSMDIPVGFTLIYPSRIINRTLENSDSIMVILDFTPTAPGEYKGDVIVYSSAPCSVVGNGEVFGEGIIVPLEIPLKVISFGFVRPCDCILREMPLINKSQVFDMSIDSIWIDSVGVANGFPEFFTWSSFYSPGGTTPYEIPKNSFDTVYIKFCPRTPAQREFVDMGAKIHIKASGSGWEREYVTFLAGKRSLIFQPFPDTILFPPTRVDTFSITQYDYLFIPDFSVNPDRDEITLDSITFIPDDKVFYASDSLGRAFPISIDSTEYLAIKLDFKPRAVRTYTAKMVLHFSDPCYFKDTTVFVQSNGFAPAYGLSLNFDNFRIRPDTFKVINCETIDVPVYSSREIPAKVIDVNCLMMYDTTKLELVGTTSPYISTPCETFVPGVTHVGYNSISKQIRAKNLCRVDSVRPMFIVTFRPKDPDRDTLTIKIDSIFFDTEDVILYELIASGDRATIIVQKPEIRILNTIVFDSVQVLDCNMDTLLIVNTGDVPAAINNLIQLPPYTVVESSTPPLNTVLDLSDTMAIVLRYCPRKKDNLDSTFIAESTAPCFIYDTTSITGTGFAPPFEVITDISSNFTVPDTVYTVLGDTVQIPVLVNRDFAAEIRGTLHWLGALRFDVSFKYNPYPLKLIRVNNCIGGNFNYDYNPGELILHYDNVDSLKAGTLANLIFLTTVPDSVISSLSVYSYGFDSDSILFLDIIPIGSAAKVNVEGKCSITYFKFSDVQTELKQNIPNPWSDKTTIEFAINEYSPVVLKIYDMTGKLRFVALDGSRTFPSGKYKIDINGTDFESGTYFYTIEAGIFKASKSMQIVK